MTIRNFRVFIEVARYLNMSKAAQALYVSQPSVSSCINELEVYYGVKLFDRINKKLYLTNEGQLLLDYANQLIKLYDDLNDAMFNINEVNIKIGSSITIGTCLLNNYINYKNYNFTSIINNTSKIEELILKCELDIGLVEGIITSKDIVEVPFYKDELVIVVGRNSELKNKTININELNNYNMITREDGSKIRNQYEQLLIDNNIKSNICMICSNTEAIKANLKTSNNYTIMSKLLVEQEIKDKQLYIVNIKNTNVYRDFRIIYHKNKYMPSYIEDVISNIKKDI